MAACAARGGSAARLLPSSVCHRTARVVRDLKDPLTPTLCHGQRCLLLDQAAQGPITPEVSAQTAVLCVGVGGTPLNDSSPFTRRTPGQNQPCWRWLWHLEHLEHCLLPVSHPGSCCCCPSQPLFSPSVAFPALAPIPPRCSLGAASCTWEQNLLLQLQEMLVLANAVDVNDLLVGSGQSRQVLGSFLHPCCAGTGRALGDSRESASSGLLGFSSFPLSLSVLQFTAKQKEQRLPHVCSDGRGAGISLLCSENEGVWVGRDLGAHLVPAPAVGTTPPPAWPWPPQGRGTPSSSPCPHIWSVPHRAVRVRRSCSLQGEIPRAFCIFNTILQVFLYRL